VRVSALNVVSPAERTRLLNEFNAAGDVSALDERAPWRCIETQAGRRRRGDDGRRRGTDAPELSETLNARANRIAWWLREARIGREIASPSSVSAAPACSRPCSES
jgi:hypothetical protein